MLSFPLPLSPTQTVVGTHFPFIGPHKATVDKPLHSTCDTELQLFISFPRYPGAPEDRTLSLTFVSLAEKQRISVNTL